MVAMSSCRSMIHVWYDGIKKARRHRAPPILRDAHTQSKPRKRYALFAVEGIGFFHAQTTITFVFQQNTAIRASMPKR